LATPKQQLDLIDDRFETARPSNSLFCHQEFLEQVAEHARDSIGRRAAFLLQRLAVDARRLHYKATHGQNRGWRRSRLGGNGGSHFYAWWAPRNAAPLKNGDGFENVPEGAVFLRAIRHHDDHSPLPAHAFDDNYMPVTVRDLRREEYAPAPWTPSQSRFANARQPIRLLKGHPGSGKTTALWHAADACGAGHVLYVTYSRDLAALARDYFDRHCSSHKRFDVMTFPALVRSIVGEDATSVPEAEARRQFKNDLAPYARLLGPWAESQMALYDEFHAHLIGDALPLAIGRFAACQRARVPDKAYRERRTRSLGPQAVAAALEIAMRLERPDAAGLAERYFPELALAWRALDRLRGAGPAALPLDFDGIAVDECQDLTPLEAFLIVQLTSSVNRGRRYSIPLLLAGDEAQTVRPTDFEWGWLSDLLHAQVGTPSEYKLAANLRSPRRIAGLVNRVWDLYSTIQKQERPSGTGYVEIEDDAPDQILYCTAAPGEDLNALLAALATREGLALITLEEAVPKWVPEAARPAVLTVAEAKGLDFHSVCVLDAGSYLLKVIKDDSRIRAGDELDDVRKRLVIDRLRVALSRPTERLIWLDVNPTVSVVHASTKFLNGGVLCEGVASCVPQAILQAIEEDELDIEERVQRCQTDARQFLQVKPELAWSRAQQAITLLGTPGSLAAVEDRDARNAAHLTLAEVCFIMGLRGVRLPPELGVVDLFATAGDAALSARRPGLCEILGAVASVHGAAAENRLQRLAQLARVLTQHKDQIEPWLRIEFAARAQAWVDELESALFNGHNAALLIRLLPGFYEALDLSDRMARTERLQQRAIQLLIKDKQYGDALAALRALPERQPKLEAQCHEGLGDFRAAAESYLAAGSPKDALNCYRSIPDLEAALKLLSEIGEHPAAESLRWISRVQRLMEERPDKFNKTVNAAEKKLLEEILERGLGVARRKPAPRKKPAAPRKPRAKSPERAT
jgi:hypothetical protein